jgi:3-isopropylmalate/(R)-2-methylmalate dehydratase small subunit
MTDQPTSGHDPSTAKVVLKLENDISTDALYPGRYMATVLSTETPQYAFGDLVEFNARLRKGEIPKGSIVVAGTNFGCGSSREQAVSALKGHELVIVARDFSRIFLQNAINLGLKIVDCPEISAGEGDELEISESEVRNRTTGERFSIRPIPAAQRAILAAGGLVAYTRLRLREKQESGRA